ncbi:MAG: M56 family metallopeptidase [Pseudomonadota bacterium]|nr:M56 family metallopeptidase [Pseudomonadota bacterium]
MHNAMETLTGIATFIGFASLKGTALLALVLLAQKAFGRHLSANGRYLLWLAVVISLVTPVGFEIALPNPFTDEQVVQARDASGTEPSIAPPADTQTVLQWQSVLPLLWLAGVLVVLAAMGASSRRFALLARNGTPAPEHVEACLRECEKLAGCRTAIRLRVSAELRAPVVSGLFKPVLLWPARLEASLTPMQLQHVLMHEVTHVKRCDIFSACIVAVLQALHWFNPAIWIAFSWLREDREMACDAATVRTLGEAGAHDYAHTLIELGAMPLPARSRLASGLDMLDGPAQLRKRIHMLAQPADPTVRHFLSTTLVLTFSAFAFSQPGTAPRIPEETDVVMPVQAETVTVAPAAIIAAHIEPEAIAAPAVTTKKTETLLAHAATREDDALPSRNVISADAAPRVEPAVKPMLEPTLPVLAVPVQQPVAAPIPQPVVLANADNAHARPAPVLEQQVFEQQDYAAPQTVLALAAEDEELTCRNVNTSGSRIRTRLCLTTAQWDAGYKVPKSAYVKNLSTLDLLDPPPLFGL